MSYMLKTSESKPLVQITLPHHPFEHQHFSPLSFAEFINEPMFKNLDFTPQYFLSIPSVITDSDDNTLSSKPQFGDHAFTPLSFTQEIHFFYLL